MGRHSAAGGVVWSLACKAQGRQSLERSNGGSMTNRSRLQRVWLRKLAARVMLRTSVGYVAASYTASRWLTRRAPVKLTQTPGDFGLNWSPLKCKTEDGIRLSGWVAEP